jgi:NAD(P)-dependent dehydrogenase (short-subunit alcohol dehydrogenase family)
VIDKVAWAFSTVRRHWSPEARAASARRSEPVEDALVSITALGRMGEPAEPAEGADVVGFLAGPDARWMTGQNLRATGGMLV